MSKTDFHFELHSEVSHLEDKLSLEVERRLRKLGENETDMIGASAAIKELAREETPHMYQARIVAYIRPDNIVAVEKGDSLETALKGALAAIERQVRERRARLRKPWRETAEGVDASVYQLSATELFDAYAAQTDPADLLELDRSNIATGLMVDEGLDEEAAYYAADRILEVAQEIFEAQE